MTGPHSAAATFRVLMSGFATEHAISFLKGGNDRVGEKWISDALGHLGHARDYLEEAPDLSLYLERVEERIRFLESALEQVRIGTPTEAVASALYDAQGILWDAAPLLPPS